MPDAPYQDYGRSRRKNARRTFHYSAKVLGPTGIQWDGFVIDISESGAQLEFFATQDIPDKFSLSIGGHRGVKRQCDVVWRSNDRLGVKFVRPGKSGT
jgi:hypothetical protein